MNKKTKNLLIALAILGVFAYFVFPGALVGQTITVTYKGKYGPVPGATCYINDQNSKTTNSAGVATFTLAREGRTEAGCYCPGTNTRTIASSYGTAITLEDISCSSGGGTTGCVDSDNGINLNVKGSACENGICQTDSCVDSNTVREAYCGESWIDGSSLGVYVDNRDCPNAVLCVDGVCKSSTPTSSTPTTTKKTTTTTLPSGVTTTTLPDDEEEQNQTLLIVGLGVGLIGLAYITQRRNLI